MDTEEQTPSKRRKWPARLIAAAVAIGALLGLPSRGLAQIANVPGYQLAWQDEFNVGENLTTNWLLTQQDNYNGEKQYLSPFAGYLGER